jgi:dynein heavy chain
LLLFVNPGAEFVDRAESDALYGLERMIDQAKTRLFLLIDFASMSPSEMRLNSATFSWPIEMVALIKETRKKIESKKLEFQELLRERRDRFLEDLENYANQVGIKAQ